MQTEMAVIFTDAEIDKLIKEQKQLLPDWRKHLSLRPRRGHEEFKADFNGESGNEFRLILRHNSINPLDFSVILAVRVPQTNRLFRLRRYNGKSHEHTSSLEKETFYDFHIHTATGRYQKSENKKEDKYAEVTTRYGDFSGALDCLIEDAGFPSEPQLSLL
ncbi:MAG: hypothetical protein OXF83_04110 [Anaerolineaceae bacterium]|nr:hypothetical protein [Anaerolineaceae bacterium]